LSVAFFLGVVLTGSYERAEKVAVMMGLFELVFIITMFLTWPSPQEFAKGVTTSLSSDFMTMVAANVGSVVMPWMLFYQSSASVGKGLTTDDLQCMRVDTFVGACITQTIMVAVICTTAKTWDGEFPGLDLETVPQFASKLREVLGPIWGETLFGLGILGGAMVGGVTVALTATWSFSEVSGHHHSLESKPWVSPGFYMGYALILTGSAFVFSMLARDLGAFNVGVQVMNALFCPVALGMIVLLSYKLPEEHQLKGLYKWVVLVSFALVSAIAVISGFYGIFGISSTSPENDA